MIRTTCPQCGREDALADYLAALPVLCKSCGHRVTMGGPIAPDVPEPLPPPPPPPKLPPPPPPKLPPPPPKPQPSVAAVQAAEAPSSRASLPLPEPVITPRPAFANAIGPDVVDLFDDTPSLTLQLKRPPIRLPRPTTKPIAMPAGPHRSRRLAARLITLAGATLAAGLGILLAGFAPPVIKNDPRLSTAILLLPLGLYALYNLVLLATQGQDFGKRVLRLSIVGEDGIPARFGRAFLKRELVVLLLLAGLLPLGWKLNKARLDGTLTAQWQRAGVRMLMPEVLPAAAGVAFSLLNVLLIVGPGGQCLHDRIAKTTVKRL